MPKGKKDLLSLILIFLVTELVFPFIISENLEETIIKTIILGWPLIFMFRGFKWAMWAATITLALNGILNIYIAIELGINSLFAIGFFNLTFVGMIQFSKEIQATLERTSEHSVASKRATTPTAEPINYPYLISRYKAALIDGLVIFGLFILTMFLVQNPEFRPVAFVVYLIAVLLYEPLMLTYFSATIGHKFVRIKVKNIDNHEQNISIVQGLIRTVFKLSLGWLSFLTINFNAEHRAIHDFASSSIVLEE